MRSFLNEESHSMRKIELLTKVNESDPFIENFDGELQFVQNFHNDG